MSPMPRLSRRASSILLAALVLSTATVALMAPAEAQAAEKPKRLITVRSQEEGCDGPSPCWDLPMIPVKAGDEVEMHIDLTSGFHDLTFQDPLADFKTPSPSNGVHTLSFTVPADFKEPIEFICTIHPTSMIGHIAPPDALGGAGEVDVVHLGVNFLAYWVGLIAFALLFIVYGATFFLFKYNETNATTDHKDRPDAVKGKMDTRAATALSLLVAVVIVVAIVLVRG